MATTNAATAASSPEEIIERNELYRLVGKALSQWADLELKLHLLAFRNWRDVDLVHLSEMLDAVISFDAKMKIVGGIVKRHSKSDEATALWPHIAAHIFKLKKKRDKIAHGIVTQKMLSRPYVLLPYISFANITEEAFNGAMTAEDLRRNIGHFEEATYLILEFSWIAMGVDRPPQGIHEQAQARLLEFRAKAALIA
jgi:hypothetical protein